MEENISRKCKNLYFEPKVTQSSEIMLHYKYLESLQKKIELLKEEIKELKEKEKKVKAMLLTKSQEKKSLERLKEIKYDEFKKEYKKHERIVLDEVSIQNYRFKQENQK